MTGRALQTMTMPTGGALLGLLPDLARALAGDGPALLPLAATDPRAAELAAALGAGRPLGPGEDDPDDPTVLVVATSGSTGTPKGVLLAARALAASAAATERRLGGGGNWLLALPAWHIAGLQVLLRASAAGGEPVVMDTAEPFTAARFAAAAARVPGPRRYVSLVPTQLRRLLADPEATSAAGLFDAVLLGGSAAPDALLAAARSAGIAVVTTYGMTETCGGCVYDGRALGGVSVTVAPSGALVLSGPMLARGYRDRPGDPAFALPGSFVTADTGQVAADGTVTVTGRLDDVIVTGGINVAPAAIEAALLGLAGVDQAVVIGTPHARWGQAVTAVIAGDAGWDLPRLRAALVRLPASHRPQRLLLVPEVPLLGSGKPDRRAARRLVEPPTEQPDERRSTGRHRAAR